MNGSNNEGKWQEAQYMQTQSKRGNWKFTCIKHYNPEIFSNDYLDWWYLCKDKNISVRSNLRNIL